LEVNVEKLVRKNNLISKNDASIKGLIEIASMKNKNPIRYKINDKGQQLFEIIKNNLATFNQKMLKSLKMILVRPSFEAEFNSQFRKIVNKLAQHENNFAKLVVEQIKDEPDMVGMSLNLKEIQQLEEEVREMLSQKERVHSVVKMNIPEHVLALEEDVGAFAIPANNEIVHEKFVNLETRECCKLEDGAVYEGQWSAEGTR
jgi:PHD/YefM family antitoxin component YafN of YafNO toxin-antitoxin module